MIYVTGDTHGGSISDVDKFLRIDDSELYKNDFIIIAGDFGFYWDDKISTNEKKWLKFFDSQNYTTLFINGNHENFNRLNAYKTC